MSNATLNFDNSQDAAALAMLQDWPDGTPKSRGNGFTAHWDGQASCMATKAELANAKHALTATRTQEEQRLQGKSNGTLLGLSAKADEEIRRRRSQISIDPNPQATADKIAKLVGRANHQRSQ